MNHKTHIRLVNAHPECDGRHDNIRLVAYETFLIPAPCLAVHPRMVRQRPEALVSQPVRQFLCILAREAVDDCRLALALSQQLHKLVKCTLLRPHLIPEVRTIEARYELLRLLQAELRNDVVAHSLSSRRSQRDERHGWHAAPHVAQRPIIRTEVVTPLRYAVRLIHRHKTNIQRPQKVPEVWQRQSLRRQIKNLKVAAPRPILYTHYLGVCQCAVDEFCCNAVCLKRIHLVFHQRNKRRYH